LDKNRGGKPTVWGELKNYVWNRGLVTSSVNHRNRNGMLKNNPFLKKAVGRKARIDFTTLHPEIGMGLDGLQVQKDTTPKAPQKIPVSRVDSAKRVLVKLPSWKLASRRPQGNLCSISSVSPVRRSSQTIFEPPFLIHS